MRATFLGALFAAAIVAACNSGTDLELKGVAVSFATRSPATVIPAPAPALLAGALDDTIISGSDILIITSVQMVLREIELEAVEVADCDVEPEPAGCQDVELGPVVVDLPLAPGAAQRFGVNVPPGTYDEIEFDIHKVSSGDPVDPTLVDKSIRVTGTFNGSLFTFESDVNVEQELTLQPPLVIDDMTTSTNLTIFVNLDAWFRASDGSLVDPASANKGGANENLVRDNIINSIRAFEDEDRDGGEG